MSDIFKYFSLEGFNLRVENQPFIFSQVSTQWTPRGMIKANHTVKQNKLHPQVPSPPSPHRNPNESPPLCPCGIYLGGRSCRGLVPMMFRQLWSVTVGVRVWEAVLPYMAGWGSTSGPTLFSSLQIVLLWVSRGGGGGTSRRMVLSRPCRTTEENECMKKKGTFVSSMVNPNCVKVELELGFYE